jgi:hypothetical protein
MSPVESRRPGRSAVIFDATEPGPMHRSFPTMDVLDGFPVAVCRYPIERRALYRLALYYVRRYIMSTPWLDLISMSGSWRTR